MDLFWFRDLAILAETGNFSQAAKLANITQPALSRRVKAIEDWVGTVLVDRSSRPVRLTLAGQQMLEAGWQALSRIESERDLVCATLSNPDKYVVIFSTQHSIGWRFYPSWLQALEKAFGPIMSRLRADDLPNCIEDLRNGEADFVIAFESDFSLSIPASSNFESLSIGTDALIPVCKTASDGSPMFDLDEDHGLPIPYLRFGETAPIGQHVDRLLRARNHHDRLKVVYENSMSGALRIRARDGTGVAWLPRSLIKPDLDAGLLTLAGKAEWSVRLDIRLHRLKTKVNPLPNKIWEFLSLQDNEPLMAN